MNKPIILFLGLLVILALCIWRLWPENTKTYDDKTLTLFCAAGLEKPVSEIVKAYKQETGRTVDVIYNGSGALLTTLKTRGGDLYLPASSGYIEKAKSDNLIDETIPTAELTAVIVTSADNPTIKSLDDLSKPGVRISMGNKTSAIGKFTRKILKQENKLTDIERNITVTKPTVNDIVGDVAIGSVDATIAWAAVAKQIQESLNSEKASNIKIISVPVFEKNTRKANIALLKSSKNPTAALHFARYLSAKDKGLKTFQKYHFKTPEKSDMWSDSPGIVLFSGTMFRSTIDDRLKQFEKREGCKISTVYKGCGVLVSDMKAGANPSFYFSCDVSFLDDVEDRFEPGTIATQNEIILLVPNDNPKNIKTLDDLNKPDQKIGIAHSEKSALGKLTHTMLANSNHLNSLKESGNIATLVSSGDELVAQMQAGALDAALLYHSNARSDEAISKYCTIIKLNRPDAIASQPYATSLDTPYPQLMHRLGEYLTNTDAKESFLEHGFIWKKN